MIADGGSDEAVSKELKISKHTIKHWKKKLITNGTLNNKKSERKPYVYKPEKIAELLSKMS